MDATTNGDRFSASADERNDPLVDELAAKVAALEAEVAGLRADRERAAQMPRRRRRQPEGMPIRRI